MKKENVIVLLVITFIAGFVIGAVSGIKFYAKDMGRYRMAPAGPVQQDSGAGQSNTAEIDRLEALVNRDPRNLEALVTLGNLYFDTRQYQKAIDAYERSLAIDPKNPNVRTDLGIMYRAVKDYDRAVKEFREAARTDPSHANSRFNLAVVLQHDKKDVRGAIAAWEDFLRLEPSGDRAESVKRELAQLKGSAG